MTFGEKMRELIDQGVTVSKDIVTKAGSKAQDLGEKGVLKLEIMQLEGQAQKLIARLGSEVYASFVERDMGSISRDESNIREILSELSSVRDSIEKREKEMKSHP